MNKFLIGAAAAFALLGAAQAQTTTLKYSNWLPPGQVMRVQVIEPWIAEVEKVTGGRVKISTLPKVIGTVPAQFDVARDGQADLVVFVPGYTPGRFEVMEVAELPFMSDNAELYGPVVDRFYRKHLASANEFAGVFPLSVFVSSEGQVFNSKRAIRSMADFKGLKLRSPQPNATQALMLLGAIPVSKPVSETYELLSGGILDGTLMPPESIPSFKLTDLVPYATTVPGAIYNTILVLGINEEKWKSLRPEDRDAIMRISGDKFAGSVGHAYVNGDKATWDLYRKNGKPPVVISGPALAEMQQVLKPIEVTWLEKARKKGIAQPEKLAEALRADIATADKTK